MGNSASTAYPEIEVLAALENLDKLLKQVKKDELEGKMNLKDRIYSGEFNNKLAFPLTFCHADREKWKADIEEYWVESRRLEGLFKAEALKEVGLEDHPSREFVYAMALETDNSDDSPYPELEVLKVLVKLAELVKQVQRDTLEAK